MGSTNARTTSGVACHHHLWAAHTVERRRAWHASIALRQHTQSKEIGRGMTSLPLDSTHGRTTLGVTCHHVLWTEHTVELHQALHDITALGLHARLDVACHHRLWTAHMVERHRARHAITTFRQLTRSNHVRHCMPSSRLGSTHGRTTSSVACHHHLWEA